MILYDIYPNQRMILDHITWTNEVRSWINW